MSPDAGAIRNGCSGHRVTTARHLCRAEIDRFRMLATADTPLTVGCTQEAALFDEVAAETGRQHPIAYANIRETAGWSRDGADAGPKMAALLSAAAEVMPSVASVTIESEGVILVYGRDEKAIQAAHLLKEHLDITVLLKAPAAGVTPPTTTEFPIAKGTIRSAKGYLGSFDIVVDDFATPAPSSRSALVFGPSRNGTQSQCDIILDLSGGVPLFPAADLRDGYLRADPLNPAGVLEAVLNCLLYTSPSPRDS